MWIGSEGKTSIRKTENKVNAPHALWTSCLSAMGPHAPTPVALVRRVRLHDSAVCSPRRANPDSSIARPVLLRRRRRSRRPTLHPQLIRRHLGAVCAVSAKCQPLTLRPPLYRLSLTAALFCQVAVQSVPAAPPDVLSVQLDQFKLPLPSLPLPHQGLSLHSSGPCRGQFGHHSHHSPRPRSRKSINAVARCLCPLQHRPLFRSGWSESQCS